MRYSIILALLPVLCLPIVAPAAFWFYPSYQSCLTDYSVPAATRGLVAYAIRACSTVADDSLPDRMRDYALCQAKRTPLAKFDTAVLVINRACDAEVPTPRCGKEEVFHARRDRCELKCSENERYDPRDDSCANPCPEGQIYIASSNQCVWRNAIVDPFKLRQPSG